MGNRSKLYNSGWSRRRDKFQLSRSFALKLAKQQMWYSRRGMRNWIKRVIGPITFKD
ncbi:hypothetical protein [Metallosphaera hakonensis]|uniref:hypothetical protein n=1 Tax=Metallosphaera hakonensis TaxID=79601 RepID=UPI00209262F3|nr:hypothetical protein [Metallosphaera hakonensis]